VITQTPDQPDPDHVLTWRQREILQVIKDFMRERGREPSMREIGEAVGLASTSSVAFQMATLQRKGYLHRSRQTVEVRLPGDRARPEPGREKDETAEMAGFNIYPLPPARSGEGDPVLVRVGCDSMSGAGIFDGDWAVARKLQQSSEQGGDLRDGDLVAADIDGVPTVRTYQNSDGHATLSPRNRAYRPTLAGEEKVEVRGRVVAVLRSGQPAA
jgi:repressor LexA